MGAKITLADITAYPFFERLSVFTHYRGVTMPPSCSRLSRWLDTMQQYPTVAATSHELNWFIPRYTSYANGTASGLSAQAFRTGTAN
jgi:glutathione S-transferase